MVSKEKRNSLTLSDNKSIGQTKNSSNVSKFDSTNWFVRFTCLFIWPLNRRLRFQRHTISSSDFDNYAPECTRLMRHRRPDETEVMRGSDANHKLNQEDHKDAQVNRLNLIEIQWDEECLRCRQSKGKQSPSMTRAMLRVYGLKIGLSSLLPLVADIVCEPFSYYYLMRMIDLTGSFEAAPQNPPVAPDLSMANSTLSLSLSPSPSSVFEHKLELWNKQRLELIRCAILLILFIGSSSLLQQLFHMNIYTLTLQMQNFFSQMIYKKALRIQKSTSNSVENQTKTTKHQQTARVDHKQAISLISRDLERLTPSFSELPWVISGPVESLTISVVLIQSLGLGPVLVTFLLTATIAFQRGYMNIKLRKHTAKAANYSDQRVSLINETLAAIRVLRMYTWTSKLMQKIEFMRAQELSEIKRSWLVAALDCALFYISCSGVAIVSLLIGFLFLGTPILQVSVSQVFLVSAIYRRTISRYLPQGIVAVTNLKIIFDRIGRYLSEPEISHNISSGYRSTKSTGSDSAFEAVLTTTNPLHSSSSSKDCIVELNQVSAKWKGAERTCLKDVSFRAIDGELIVVVGRVGCGKSSLFQVLLSELKPESGSMFIRSPKDSNGAPPIAYAPQEPWIFTGTIRENILFGEPMDLQRYIRVLRACCLLADLIAFDEFDRTQIGERGVTLSGGQKARINLARALYQQVDLYLLDDPLSAVDAHVAQHIFREAFKGFLADKTVILVTHQLQFVRFADKVLILSSLKDTQQVQDASAAAATRNEMDYPIFGNIEQLSERLGQENDWIAHLREQRRQNNEEDVDDADDVEANDELDLSRKKKSGAESMSDEAIGKLIGSGAPALSFAIANNFKMLMAKENSTATTPAELRGVIDKVQRQNVLRPIVFYLRQCGLFGVLLCIVTTTLCRVCFIGANIWLNLWAGFYRTSTAANDGDDEQQVLANATGESVHIYHLNNDYAGDYNVRELSLLEQWVSQMDMSGAFMVVGLIWLLLVVVSVVRGVQFFRMVSSAATLIHRKLMQSILNARMTFFDNTPHGNLINRISADIDHMDHLFVKQMDDIFQQGFALVLMFSAMFLADFKLSLGAAMMFSMLCAMLKRITDVTETIKHVDGFRRSAVYSHVSVTLDGLAVIRAAHKQTTFMRIYEKVVEKNASVTFLTLSIRRLVTVTFDWSLMSFYVILVSLDVYNSLQGKGQYSFVGLNFMVQLTRMGQNFFTRLIELITTIQSIDRIDSYCKLESEQTELYGHYKASIEPVVQIVARQKKRARGVILDQLSETTSVQVVFNRSKSGRLMANFRTGSIEFIGVSFEYESSGKGSSATADEEACKDVSKCKSSLVLRDISFKIEPREKIGIVGRTGAGKSSLIAVLFHLYHFEGFVVIDGQQTKRLDLDSLRRSLSIIPQDPILFSGTLRQNLDPLEEHSDAEIWRSLESVQLKKLVSEHSDKLEMQVSESGDNFSVGQRQLICLARAILRRNKILVLDEATANVDLETDQLIQGAIRSEFEDCTVLTVAHRLNTIVDSDRILVLDKGKLCEFDSPKALLEKQNSLFAKMVASTGRKASARLRAQIMNHTHNNNNGQRTKA